jgi:benzoyl-CoA 2,3-dioxygenase component B
VEQQRHLGATAPTRYDLRQHGGIPLSVIQKYLNFRFSVSLDLFGSELSGHAAGYYTVGLKGRWSETRRKDDHVLVGATRELRTAVDGAFATQIVPLLDALILDLRDEYTADGETGVKRWNQVLAEAGLPHRLSLPHEGFNRRVAVYSGVHVSPDGRILDDATWAANVDHRLPGPRSRR